MCLRQQQGQALVSIAAVPCLWRADSESSGPTCQCMRLCRWYPGCSRDAANGFQPSAALVKASLIASAVAPRGSYEFDGRSIRLMNTPNEAAGFG
jgi:hypothetical protein